MAFSPPREKCAVSSQDTYNMQTQAKTQTARDEQKTIKRNTPAPACYKPPQIMVASIRNMRQNITANSVRSKEHSIDSYQSGHTSQNIVQLTLGSLMKMILETYYVESLLLRDTSYGLRVKMPFQHFSALFRTTE